MQTKNRTGGCISKKAPSHYV